MEKKLSATGSGEGMEASHGDNCEWRSAMRQRGPVQQVEERGGCGREGRGSRCTEPLSVSGQCGVAEG